MARAKILRASVVAALAMSSATWAEVGNSYLRRHGYTNLGIPDGHLPPPGECRVWYPGKPPGQQPPPGRCDALQVPPGAWMLRRSDDKPRNVEVEVYDPRRPNVVIDVGFYDASTGAVVRILGER